MSVLPAKMFEKVDSEQVTLYMDEYLSVYHCGFRKGYSAPYYLLEMFQKWKEVVDNEQ